MNERPGGRGTEGDDSPGEPPRSWLAIGVIASVVMVPLLYLAFSGSGGDETASDGQIETDPTEATNEAPTTAVTSTTTIASTAEPTQPDRPSVPVLEELVGLELWVGGDSRVSRIDLDSSQRLQLGRRGYPLIVSGPWLLYYDRLESRYLMVDRADPSIEDELDAGDDFEITAIAEATAEGTIWVADSSAEPGVSWLLLSLETGAPLRSAQTESISILTIADGVELAEGPEVDQRGDAVWRMEGAGYERWFRGTVIAREHDLALVENCASSCALEWRTISTGDRVERPVPPNLLDLNELLGDGNWFYSRTTDVTTSLLIDAESFEEIDTNTRRKTRPFDIDPTGRWAAFTGSQRVWILDLETGVETPVPGGRSLVGATASILFAPNSQ